MSSRNRLTERLIQLENAIRSGVRSKYYFPVSMATLGGLFVLTSIVTGLILYYRKKDRYTNPLDGKILWRDLILHTLGIGAGVTALGSLGLYAFTYYFSRPKTFM